MPRDAARTSRVAKRRTDSQNTPSCRIAPSGSAACVPVGQFLIEAGISRHFDALQDGSQLMYSKADWPQVVWADRRASVCLALRVGSFQPDPRVVHGAAKPLVSLCVWYRARNYQNSPSAKRFMKHSQELGEARRQVLQSARSSCVCP